MTEPTEKPLPPIMITITPEDFEDISKAMEALPESKKKELGNAIRNEELDCLTAADRDFVRVIASFAKITERQRDKKLIRDTFSIEGYDLDYLISEIAPKNGILNNITSYTINGREPAEPKPEQSQEGKEPQGQGQAQEQAQGQGQGQGQGQTAQEEQPELFPDLKPDPPPTFAVDYNETGIHRDKAYIATSKAAQVITRILNRETTPILVSRSGTKKRMEITVTIDQGNLPEEITLARPISFRDRIVEDAIGNLFDQGFSQITPAMVYRQINGLSDTRAVTPAAERKIDISIRRLASTWVQIDYTEQLRAMARDKGKIEKGVIQGNIINANNVYLQFADGTIKSGWKIKDMPKIFAYSKQVKQIATVPTALLNTSTVVQSTEENTAAKYYLLTQIERIKGTGNKRILFNSLFETIGDAAPLEKTDSARKIRSRRIESILKILDHFKEQGHIAGYSIVKLASKIEGVDIDLPDPPDKGK